MAVHFLCPRDSQCHFLPLFYIFVNSLAIQAHGRSGTDCLAPGSPQVTHQPLRTQVVAPPVCATLDKREGTAPLVVLPRRAAARVAPFSRAEYGTENQHAPCSHGRSRPPCLTSPCVPRPVFGFNFLNSLAIQAHGGSGTDCLAPASPQVTRQPLRTQVVTPPVCVTLDKSEGIAPLVVLPRRAAARVAPFSRAEYGTENRHAPCSHGRSRPLSHEPVRATSCLWLQLSQLTRDPSTRQERHRLSRPGVAAGVAPTFAGSGCHATSSRRPR